MDQQPVSARAVFDRALEIEAAEQRRAYLKDACAGSPGLREKVEGLMRAHDDAGSFLEPAAADLLATIDEPITERPGTVVGPYRLLEQIGEGGMGLVFVAEQHEPIRRKVALKVLKPGMDSRAVVVRFEAERQALALMDHPHIARVFDGGETAGGRPYFVMELVRGVPITRFCDDNRFSPRQRLELFSDVCSAVQHAHQKGIIHRDLKPSNVMVTSHDGTPVVKVIDFGVAKAIGGQLTERTLFTGFTQMVGTPLYMSPEQAGQSGLDIDTRSDVYSLGVLLYELLTGTTPFARERFKEAGYDEMRRIIREEEPPRPSTRLSTLGQAATIISMQRQSDPKRLCQLCRGELDWIVMKCLDKDRNRRYDTANALARDVERYLRDEPVLACPPSALYRLGKFARRNKRALVTAALLGVMVLLAVGAVTGSLGWAARDRAERVAATERKATGALEEATKLEGQKRWPEALEAVRRAEGFLAGGNDQLRDRVRQLRKDVEMALRLEEIRLPGAGTGPALAEPPGRVASYSRAFRDYGIDVEALEPAQAAVRVRARTIWLELTMALDHWARERRNMHEADDTSWQRLVAVARLADPDPRRDRLRQALQRQDRTALVELATSADVANLAAPTLVLLGEALAESGVSGEAVAVLRQGQRRYPGDFGISRQLGWHLGLTRPDEAIRFLTAALAIRPSSVQARLDLGGILLHKGAVDEAVATFREVTRLQPDCVEGYSALGLALRHKGALKESLAAYRMALGLQPAPAAVPGLPALGPTLEVRSPRHGILLVLGTEVAQGEKVGPDRLVAALVGGRVKTYRCLEVGDVVEAGQLLARLDDRRALAELAVRQNKAAAALANLAAARAAQTEAEDRCQRALRLRGKKGVSQEELARALLARDRAARETEVSKAELEAARDEVKQAQAILGLHEIRSPIRGVVKCIYNRPGEAVRSLQRVLGIQELKGPGPPG
jgi:serine/threonine protein kinase/Flp pilus assembly protein TadD/biotin carboxyl carrier protein